MKAEDAGRAQSCILRSVSREAGAAGGAEGKWRGWKAPGLLIASCLAATALLALAINKTDGFGGRFAILANGIR